MVIYLFYFKCIVQPLNELQESLMIFRFGIKILPMLVLTLTLFSNSYAIETLELVENTLDITLADTNLQQRKVISFTSESFNNQILVMKLEKIQAFNQEAEIILHTSQGTSVVKPPKTNYFEGYIENKEGSHVFLDFTDTNDIKGIISLGNQSYFYQSKAINSKNRKSSIKKIYGNAEDNVQCLNEKFKLSHKNPSPLFSILPNSLMEKEVLNNKNTYIANLTLETDYEYYNLFNDSNKAIKYAADLTAYTSSIYKRELNALLKIKKLNIYLTNNNPWQAADVSGLLSSLESHYTTTLPSTTRETAIHLLSGKRIGGLAYIGSLCNNSTKFGVSGGLYGTFNINEPKIVWDAKVFAHELGHNFGAVHTHTYYPQPIDCCFFESSSSICANYEPYTQLPGLNSLTGGEPEKGTGTIMSYCHKITGKLNNISLTLGRHHSYGIDADRVPDDMRSHLLSARANSPQCLPIHFPGFTNNIFWSASKYMKTSKLLVGDFNGDTRSDLIDFNPNNKTKIYVSLSDSSAFKHKKLWLNSFALNGASLSVGDFNGDSKDDLIKLPLNNNEPPSLAISTGNTFEITQVWSVTNPESQGKYFIGDFNGDKKSDLGFLATTTNKFYVATSTGTHFAPFQVWANPLATDIHTITVGDFNGDQKDDLSLTTRTLSNRLYIRLSNGRKLKALDAWTNSLASDLANLETSDVNADGLDDLLYTKVNSKQIHVMLSNKVSFDESQAVGTLDHLVQDKIYTGRFNHDNAADILTISNESPAMLGVMTSLIR